MTERWSKISVIFGVLLILSGITSAYFQFKTGLKYANLGSYPRWVAPIPTRDDALILSIPSSSIMLAGLALLVAGYYFRNRFR
jgi:hypothetical protein